MHTNLIHNSTILDLSLLPPADLQFLVVSDTHYVLPDNAQTAEWSAVRDFPERTERALSMAGSVPHDFAVHLGDVSHEYPETGRAHEAWNAALAQFQEAGLHFHQAAGNMDIGDKPDPTSPAAWVSSATLNEWHRVFGPSWHSFDVDGVHGVVLNSQIMNGPLPENEAQQRWAEEDLTANSGKRILLFLHMPVFFVHRGEWAFGFYNSLDEPARSWLLKLIERYEIELVFAGHTHFVALNRAGSARMYVAPSTATSRAGLAEAFTSVSPDRGRGDVDKLGFYLVRMDNEGARVHLVRTGRYSPALEPENSNQLVVSRISRELPHGRLGVMSSHPLGHVTPGPVIWPSVIRQPMRDDWRLLSCIEIGATIVRVPASDLTEPTERERLVVLRDEGIKVVPYWLWTDRIDLGAEILAHRETVDGVEIVLPGTALPSPDVLGCIDRLQDEGISVTLSTALSGVAAEGQYHQRTRVGFLPVELAELASALQKQSGRINRATCRLLPDESIWPVAEALRNLSSAEIGDVDCLLDFASEDDAHNANVVAEAMLAVSTVPNARLVIGPLVDLDRSMDVAHGLLDRLSNPRPAFHVARCLNTLLFASDEPPAPTESEISGECSVIISTQGDRRLSLVLGRQASPDGFVDDIGRLYRDQPGVMYDLAAGLSAKITSRTDFVRHVEPASGPLLYVDTQGS